MAILLKIYRQNLRSWSDQKEDAVEFKEIVAPSIRELFVQQVVGMILSGQLRSGDKLPTERELADEMKISKTAVHEGIRELHRLGFLDVTSRRGVSVADYAQTGTLDTLLAIMRYHGGQLDAKTCRSILKVRYYLEGPAFLELAASHTDADLARLDELYGQAEAASREGVYAFANALFRYHRTVTFLSGNSITPLILNAFSPVSLEFWREYIEVFGADSCLERLKGFTDHIRAGEGEAAVALFREGLEEFERRTERTGFMRVD